MIHENTSLCCQSKNAQVLPKSVFQKVYEDLCKTHSFGEPDPVYDEEGNISGYASCLVGPLLKDSFQMILDSTESKVSWERQILLTRLLIQEVAKKTHRSIDENLTEKVREFVVGIETFGNPVPLAWFFWNHMYDPIVGSW